MCVRGSHSVSKVGGENVRRLYSNRTTLADLQQLLDQVRTGSVTPDAAAEQVLQLVQRAQLSGPRVSPGSTTSGSCARASRKSSLAWGKRPNRSPSIAAEIVVARAHAARDSRERRGLRRGAEGGSRRDLSPDRPYHHVPSEGRSARPRHHPRGGCGHVGSAGGRGSVRDGRGDGQHRRSAVRRRRRRHSSPARRASRA